MTPLRIFVLVSGHHNHTKCHSYSSTGMGGSNILVLMDDTNELWNAACPTPKPTKGSDSHSSCNDSCRRCASIGRIHKRLRFPWGPRLSSMTIIWRMEVGCLNGDHQGDLMELAPCPSCELDEEET